MTMNLIVDVHDGWEELKMKMEKCLDKDPNRKIAVKQLSISREEGGRYDDYALTKRYRLEVEFLEW